MEEATAPVPELSEKDKARFWKKVDKNGPLPDQSNPHYAGLEQCWVWTGAKAHGVYGTFTLNRKSLGSHRVAFLLQNGHFPILGHACHRCDNPACVRPDHLFDGSGKTNAEDAVLKGRIPKGDKSWASLNKDKMPRGDRNGSRTKPESRPRGDSHWSKIKPQCAARGDNNGSRKYPERLIRGDVHPKAKLTRVKVTEIRRLWALGNITKEQLARDYGVSGFNIAAIVNNRTWKDSPAI